MNAVQPRITYCTLTKATIDHATIVAWPDLLAAAQQDRKSSTTEKDHRGNYLGPNQEHELADLYRALLREALPKLRQIRDEVYKEDCRWSSNAGDVAAMAGHGSAVSGPVRPQTYRQWDALIRQMEQAIV